MSVQLTFPTSITVTAAGTDADIMSITPTDDHPCRLKSLLISNSSEVAEAQEEDIRFQLVRQTVFVAGSGGGTVTAGKTKRASASTNAPTVRANDTTRSTGGATEVLLEFGWNERATPLELRWDDIADQFDVIQGEGLILYMPGTVADDMTMQVTAVVEVDG